MNDGKRPAKEALIDRTVEGSAPAKLNLTLRVVGRREDGYHLLQMRNVLLGFGDTVTIRFLSDANARSIVGRAAGVVEALPPDFFDITKNLAALAAERFLATLGISLGFEIALVKNIPSGAGLGGGSSDAAAVLRLLADAFRLWRELSASEMSALALGLGADVPFFLGGQSALVGGIGEVVTPCRETGLEGVECLVVLPPASVPTPRAYELFRITHPVIQRVAHEPAPVGGWGNRSGFIENDLEAVVGAAYPPVKEVLTRLRVFDGVVAGMTGSGSALFCLPRTGKELPPGLAERIEQMVGCPVVRTSIL